jgi:serine/threonine protein kinase
MEKILQNNFVNITYRNSGGYSKLFFATDYYTGEEVAIKVSKLRTPSKKEVFQREVSILQLLSSQCTFAERVFCQLRTAMEFEDVGMMVLEKMEIDLLDFIVANGHLPLPLAKSIFRKVCEAVFLLHNMGIAHLDLKPDNILLNFEPIIHPSKMMTLCDAEDDNQLAAAPSCSPRGSAPARRSAYSPTSPGSRSRSRSRMCEDVKVTDVKLCDFGFARCWDIDHSEPIHIASPGIPIGTTMYMAPEIRNVERATEFSMIKADCYSLGLILFSLLTGAMIPLDSRGFANRKLIKSTLKNFGCINAYPLIRSLVHRKASHRPTMAEVLVDPWLLC